MARGQVAAGEGETRFVRTSDGKRLSLTRIPGRGRGGAPVVLLHGLASNRLPLDFPGRSLARYLAARGADVWLPELRGSGQSDKPREWTFDDHVMLDLPAIFDAVRAATGASLLSVVGHSMGGLLTLCYGIAHGSDGFESVVTIGSALDYRTGATGYRDLLRLRRVIERMPMVPWGKLMRTMAPLLGRGPQTPVERFNVVRENIDGAVVRQLHASVFEAIPPLLLSSLATTFEPDGLSSPCGARAYWSDAESFAAPTTMLAGTGDEQVSVEAVHATAARLPACEVEVFGRAHGCVADYGHFDLLLGDRAESEVWPAIAARTSGT